MTRKADIKKKSRLLDDIFSVDEVIVTHEQVDGSMSRDQRRLVFERGDAAAVLLLNRDRKAVVLVEQFKVPTLIGRRRDDPKTVDGWVLETVAGIIDDKETPEATAIRETKEETGYQIRNPKLISHFFSSPGGTSERIFLYFAEVHDSDLVDKGGGIDDEDLKVVHMSLDALFERLANGTLEDPKLIVGAYWLQEHVKSSADRKRLIEVFWEPGKAPVQPAASRAPSAALLKPGRYALRNNKGFVGFKTGSIDRIKDVSIWVNSENTDMMMDRFLGRTLSARIRYLGANKDQNENVIEDTIEEALRSAVGRRAHVKIGTVFVTESGQLLTTHGVKRIFHVATVQGGVGGGGFKAELSNMAVCMEKVLRRADVENNRVWRKVLGIASFDSILVPMFGTGDGGLTVEDVAQTIIPPAIDYLGSSDGPTLKEIYFLAFNASQRSACEKVLEEHVSNGTLVPAPESSPAAASESADA